MADLWTCPTCKAQFKTRNQWHSCLRKDLDAHFINRPDEFVLIFDRVVTLFESLGEFRIRSVPSTILFRKKANFTAIKVQKSAVVIEWITNRIVDDGRIHKVLQTSKNRFGHVMKVRSLEDIDQSLVGYLSEAFDVAEPL